VATWNIREFGSGKYGGRLHDALCFLAEVIRHFDVVAIQEIRRNLTEFRKLWNILGRSQWDAAYSFPTHGCAGNNERLGFFYHAGTIDGTGEASNVVLPGAGKGGAVRQPARAPYIFTFCKGGCELTICTVHIYFGESRRDDPQRVDEIAGISRLLATKTAKHVQNLMLMGDFNIFSRAHDHAMEELLGPGFVIPDTIRCAATNQRHDKEYDQIVIFKDHLALIRRGAGIETDGGVVDYYASVFRNSFEYPRRRHGESFEDWRSYQMSDHLVLWLELAFPTQPRP
jgi:Endonuclease/Exonuclease/phosphatase family